MLTVESALVVGGKQIRLAPMGERFEVIATDSAKGLVFVSTTGTDGKKVMVSLPLANVAVVDAVNAVAQAAGAVPQSAIPQPDAQGVYASLDVAKYFKADRAAAAALFGGKPLKVRGAIERASTPVGSDSPVVYFATAQGLPKVKLQLLPAISNNREFYGDGFASHWYYYGWYGSGHRLEYRAAGKGLEARFRYKYGGNATSKAVGDWFPIFTPGDRLIAEGTCKGLMMDVVIEGADMSRDKR